MILDISTFDGKTTVLVEGTHTKESLVAELKKEGVLRKGMVVTGLARTWAVSQRGNPLGITTWREVLEGAADAQEITIGTLRRV